MALTLAEELRHVVQNSKTRVLEVEGGLNELIAMCQEKAFFARETWTRMALPGVTPHDQMRALLHRRSTDFSNVAIWINGRYLRLLTRESQSTMFSVLTLGTVPTPAQRLELFRALWDIGVERFYGYIRKDHPILQFSLGTDLPPKIEPCPSDPESVCTVYPVDAKGPRP